MVRTPTSQGGGQQVNEQFIHNQVFKALDKILSKANQVKHGGLTNQTPPDAGYQSVQAQPQPACETDSLHHMMDSRPHHKRAETFAIPSSGGVANMNATTGDPSASNLIDLTANALANGYQTARSTASSGQIYQLP